MSLRWPPDRMADTPPTAPPTAPATATNRPDASPPGGRRPVASPRRVDSSDLFGNDRLLEIAHAGAVYRLSLTALGKLILTK